MTLTELLDVLADERRRRILDTIERADARLPVEILANALAPDDSSDDEIKTVQVSLVHTHLPRLADAGLLTFDRDDRAVWPTSATSEALSVVDAAQKVS
ncbi:DUF7344 domain-containing protein [Haloprofundus halobius]|uniref:DUF7344 domain-containing protein n=1 Tax=Haloprofundus halobius TaxID=2876194 RepID=UPI001CCC37B6|nr:hypothetical protein [Haloprofundus halobius]